MDAISMHHSGYSHYQRLPALPDGLCERLGVSVTRHAWQRMCGRGISPDKVDLVLEWGRVRHEAGSATSHFIGRREVARAAHKGVNIAHLEGLTIMMSLDGSTIITAWRNRSRRARRH